MCLLLQKIFQPQALLLKSFFYLTKLCQEGFHSGSLACPYTIKFIIKIQVCVVNLSLMAFCPVDI